MHSQTFWLPKRNIFQGCLYFQNHQKQGSTRNNSDIRRTSRPSMVLTCATAFPWFPYSITNTHKTSNHCMPSHLYLLYNRKIQFIYYFFKSYHTLFSPFFYLLIFLPFHFIQNSFQHYSRSGVWGLLKGHLTVVALIFF